MSALSGRTKGQKGTSESRRRRSGSGSTRWSVVTSAALLVAGFIPAVSLVAPSAAHAVAPEGAGFNLNTSDLRFILNQIKIAERHAATATAQNPCGTLRGNGANQIANPLLPQGLRTVDGSCNNLLPGGVDLGRAQQIMPRLAGPVWRDGEDSNIPGIGPVGPPGQTSYAQNAGSVVDSRPRTVSNLIVDQTSSNPAAVQAAAVPRRSFDREPTAVPCTAPGVPAGCTPAGETLRIPNISTDAGLSPPFNSWFTLFGQFFDHGLDLTVKGGSGTVFVPLKDDDPLVAGDDGVFGTADDLPPQQRFMAVTRATNLPGPDGRLGTADDVHDATNLDTPWVDQNQTYGSHPAQQVFLREYVLGGSGPIATGRLIEGGTGGMATWAEVKTQARDLLGVDLVDTDVTNVPQLVSDPYGNFTPGPNGFPQIVLQNGALREGNPASPVSTDEARRSGIAFLDDIAHHANPRPPLTPDADDVPSETGAGQPAGTYDDEMLGEHFISGDGRINENIGLTAVHQIFHSEHNRLVAEIDGMLNGSAADSAAWHDTSNQGAWDYQERLFQAARFVTEMEYQHLVFEEFARKVQPALDLFTAFDPDIDPAINAEFAHAVYRFGHSMLTDTIDRSNAPDIALLQGFLNPLAYDQHGTMSSAAAAGGLAMGMADQTGNEIDEFVTETLRNNLLGLPLDLASINMTRAREAGVPPLNPFRRQLFASTGDSSLRPYSSWSDFGLNLKHPYSLVNFVAAYGEHQTIAGGLAQRRAAAELLVNGGAGAPADREAFLDATGAYADRAGLEEVDLWVGGLAESTRAFGGMLGSTFTYVFEQQMLKLQDGDRLYYLSRLAGLNLASEIEGNSFAEMIMRNTDAEALKADVFGVADREFEIANLPSSGPLDDPTTEFDESLVLTRMPDGTIRYRPSNTVDPPGLNPQSTFNGTDAGDRVWGGLDNDTFWGNDGDDRVEGDDGDDTAIGGLGDDTLTDVNGDDVLKGGRGDDAMDAGPGLDIMVGGPGNDFASGGVNADEVFAGEGGDLVDGGSGEDTVQGDSGDDWIEGGAQTDEISGDSAAPLFDDLNAPGNDVIDGQTGDDALAGEGGDDILLAGPGIDENIGVRGFDWVTHAGDPLPANADLERVLEPLPPPGGLVNDQYDGVEALSGWQLDDVLRGDDAVPATDFEPGVPVGSNVLRNPGIDNIAGLRGLLPAGSTSFGSGNILLGGAGSDLIEGRGGDDVIDGDRWLDVRLQASGQTFTDLAALRDAVLAGTVDPGGVVTEREVVDPANAAGDLDTARFSDVRANYTVSTAGAVTTVTHHPVPVPGAPPPVNDGTDTLRGIERLIFADAIVPAQPDDFVVTTSAGDRSATIRWSGPAADAATQFEVRWDDPVSGLDRVRLVGSDHTVTIGNLVNGHTYNFQVWALHAQPPNPRWVVPTGPVVPAAAPRQPLNVTAVPGNGSARVRWSPPADDGGSRVTHYLVRTLNAAGSPVGQVRRVNAPATTVVVRGLTNGTRYRFEVIAVNRTGASDPPGLSGFVRPATVPSAPRVGTAAAGPTGDTATSATARWSPPQNNGGANVSGYRVTALRMSSAARNAQVLRRTTSTLRPAGARSYVFRLTPGVYRFRVVARNAMGDSRPSARSNAVRAR